MPVSGFRLEDGMTNAADCGVIDLVVLAVSCLQVELSRDFRTGEASQLTPYSLLRVLDFSALAYRLPNTFLTLRCNLLYLSPSTMQSGVIVVAVPIDLAGPAKFVSAKTILS
jgi:hypothetical protein